MTYSRLRDLGITIGNLPTGPHNAITDVAGVWVGHCTVIYDEPRIARTGVTMILPRGGEIRDDLAFAGLHSFNGFGEMTGTHWVTESGLLCSPIGITNTLQVGLVRDAIIQYAIEKGYSNVVGLPVVAETYDGWLNDVAAFHLTREHVYQALDSAKGGLVEEGNVGGGTGMVCHGFKGGIGTSSRVVDSESGRFTVGVLVQANYGIRRLLRVDGVPVGREIGPQHTPIARRKNEEDGSIIVIVATDAPLLPVQCKRLARRATAGMAQVGGIGYNSSGDIFLAFTTGNHIPAATSEPADLKMVPHDHMDSLFEGVVEATAEAILNALTAAETMTGFEGHTAHELPLDELQRIMMKYCPNRQ